MNTDERDKALATLREPFPPEVVGKLPRVTCPDCSKRQCQRHQKSKCHECGAYISSQHIHLDYVGHAETTDRLLSVDPEWSWEPVAFGADGLPVIGRGAGGESVLWIRLTVCGVTRLGVGSVASGAFDTEKQLVGDALRNAAMRFGVALDLWAKSELESSLPAADDPPPPPAGSPAPTLGRIRRADQSGPATSAENGEAETPKQMLARFAKEANWSGDEIKRIITTTIGRESSGWGDLSEDEVNVLIPVFAGVPAAREEAG